MAKKILITGSTGFVGQALYSHLNNKGYNCIGLTHKTRIENQNAVVGDVMDKSTLLKCMKGVNAVVHCAAKVGGNWSKKEYGINSEGTKNVLDVAINCGVEKVVHMSSLAVVDEYIDHYNDSEDIPYASKFKDYYTPSKIEAEKFALERKDDVNIIILRPGWIWGHGDKSTKQLFEMIKKHKFMFIGNGNNLTYFSYIANVIQAIDLALLSNNVKSGEIFNITDGVEITMAEFINMIAKELGVAPVRRHIPFWLAYCTAFFIEKISSRTGFTRQNVSIMSKNLHFNITKAENILGYKPDKNLKNHIKMIIDKEFITERTASV